MAEDASLTSKSEVFGRKSEVFDPFLRSPERVWRGYGTSDGEMGEDLEVLEVTFGALGGRF